MPEYLTMTWHVYKGGIYPHHGVEIEVVGHEVNHEDRPVVRVVGTDRYFVLEGAVYGGE